MTRSGMEQAGFRILERGRAGPDIDEVPQLAGEAVTAIPRRRYRYVPAGGEVPAGQGQPSVLEEGHIASREGARGQDGRVFSLRLQQRVRPGKQVVRCSREVPDAPLLDGQEDLPLSCSWPGGGGPADAGSAGDEFQ